MFFMKVVFIWMIFNQALISPQSDVGAGSYVFSKFKVESGKIPNIGWRCRHLQAWCRHSSSRSERGCAGCRHPHLRCRHLSTQGPLLGVFKAGVSTPSAVVSTPPARGVDTSDGSPFQWAFCVGWGMWLAPIDWEDVFGSYMKGEGCSWRENHHISFGI